MKKVASLNNKGVEKNRLLLLKQDYETKRKQFNKYRWFLGPLALFQKIKLNKVKREYEKENSKADEFLGNANNILTSDKKQFKILNVYSLGTDTYTQPIFVDNINQHISLFGGSGSGKSVWLFSLLKQSLERGGGFSFLDGKGDLSMYHEMIRLAADAGRLDDFLILNFNEENSRNKNIKVSNSFSIFEVLELTDIQNIVSSLTVGKATDFFGKQTESTLNNIFYILEYMKQSGELIDFNVFSEALDLKALMVNYLPASKDDPNKPDPNYLRWNGLENYAKFWVRKDFIHKGIVVSTEILSLLSKYDKETKIWKNEDEASENGFKCVADENLTQQVGGYAGMTISAIKNIVMPYSHIFNTPKNDIDFEKAIAQNKIIYILIPAMKMSAKTPHALGAFVLESMKTAASKALGDNPEIGSGDIFEDFNKIQRTANPIYPIVLDELASFFEMSLNSIGLFLAQARSIQLSVVFSSQDVASLAGAEGGKAFVDKAMGNTYTSVFLKTIDSQTIPYAESIIDRKKGQINDKGEEIEAETKEDLISFLKGAKLGIGIMINEKFGKFVTPYAEPKTPLDKIKFKPTS